MQDHLVLEFWEEVVSILKSRGMAEIKARTEILQFLRDVGAREAETAIYHFGEEYAADAIQSRGADTSSPAKSRKRKVV